VTLLRASLNVRSVVQHWVIDSILTPIMGNQNVILIKLVKEMYDLNSTVQGIPAKQSERIASNVLLVWWKNWWKQISKKSNPIQPKKSKNCRTFDLYWCHVGGTHLQCLVLVKKRKQSRETTSDLKNSREEGDINGRSTEMNKSAVECRLNRQHAIELSPRIR